MNRVMKPSKVDWIGDIPDTWTIKRVKHGFYRKKEEAHQEDPIILSLARSGVKVRDMSHNEGQIAESYYNYNPVVEGDLLLNPMDLISGANCSISEVDGVISPAYINLGHKEGYYSLYYDYYFKTQYWGMAMFAHGKGVSFENRWTLSAEDLMNYYIPVPPYEEQVSIAHFIKNKCDQIDSIIEKTQFSIDEYKKLKSRVINRAVTKGINENVERISTPITWIKYVPKHWELKKAKYCVAITNGSDPKTDGDIPVYGSGANSFKTCGEYKEGPTVLIGRKGATLHIPHFIEGKYWNVDTAFDVKAKVGYDLKYYYYAACCFDYSYYISQTTLPGMTQTNYENMFIPVPPINEQMEIVEYLDEKITEIDRLIEKKEQTLREIEKYKRSLIFHYITGKKEVPKS